MATLDPVDAADKAAIPGSAMPYPQGTAKVADLGLFLQAIAELAPRSAAGIATVPAAASGVLSSLAVVFPVGRFTVAPVVLIIPGGAFAVTSPIYTWPTAVTAAGFTANATRNGAALPAYACNWIAVQAPS